MACLPGCHAGNNCRSPYSEVADAAGQVPPLRRNDDFFHPEKATSIARTRHFVAAGARIMIQDDIPGFDALPSRPQQQDVSDLTLDAILKGGLGKDFHKALLWQLTINTLSRCMEQAMRRHIAECPEEEEGEDDEEEEEVLEEEEGEEEEGRDGLLAQLGNPFRDTCPPKGKNDWVTLPPQMFSPQQTPQLRQAIQVASDLFN